MRHSDTYDRYDIEEAKYPIKSEKLDSIRSKREQFQNNLEDLHALVAEWSKDDHIVHRMPPASPPRQETNSTTREEIVSPSATGLSLGQLIAERVNSQQKENVKVSEAREIESSWATVQPIEVTATGPAVSEEVASMISYFWDNPATSKDVKEILTDNPRPSNLNCLAEGIKRVDYQVWRFLPGPVRRRDRLFRESQAGVQCAAVPLVKLLNTLQKGETPDRFQVSLAAVTALRLLGACSLDIDELRRISLRIPRRSLHEERETRERLREKEEMSQDYKCGDPSRKRAKSGGARYQPYNKRWSGQRQQRF